MDKYTMGWDIPEPFVKDAFMACGVPRADAEICADVLLESDRRGIESHGVNRFKPIYIDRIRAGQQSAVTNIEVVRETPATAVLDGNHGMGQVVAHRAMATAIEKAKSNGLGMTAVRNSTHFGIAGYYCSMAADAGCIGMVGTNARPSIAPTYGVENMLGTNPLSFGIPTDEPFPFMFDCATSITQRGRIESDARLGKPTPGGHVITGDGAALTDSASILKALTDGSAALAPLGGSGDQSGGYKGYGFATVVEILSSALQGGRFLRALSGFENGRQVPYALGHFFLAINAEAFLGIDTLKRIAGDICRELRSSKKAPGHDHIYTAGEKEYLTWMERKDTGVPINQGVMRDLVNIRDMCGLKQYVFPFEPLEG
ncbi:MAG: Ldh family oxidoreductase [Oscillospiraceae bacterium]|nr:Ldh family oxidoreductase [Oscillospiraceae bacterium]